MFCTAVVNGLDPFQVGMPSVFPKEGSRVNHNSYTVCGTWNDVVSEGLVITIDCSPSTQRFRYVIVQSLDRAAERLCIAEVAVNEGQSANITFALVQQQSRAYSSITKKYAHKRYLLKHAQHACRLLFYRTQYAYYNISRYAMHGNVRFIWYCAFQHAKWTVVKFDAGDYIGLPIAKKNQKFLPAATKEF